MGQLLLAERTDCEVNESARFGRQQFLAGEVERDRPQIDMPFGQQSLQCDTAQVGCGIRHRYLANSLAQQGCAALCIRVVDKNCGLLFGFHFSASTVAHDSRACAAIQG